jgi:hypothetical protein
MILRDNFDAIFTKYPNIDLVKMEQLLTKPRSGRNARKNMRNALADAGIREATILNGIDLALRIPTAEIQYLDYLLYAIQIMSDD